MIGDSSIDFSNLDMNEEQLLLQRLSKFIVDNSINELHINFLDDLKYFYANEALTENSGYSLEELRGKNIFDLIQGPFLCLEDIQKLDVGKKLIRDCKIKRKDQSEYYGNLCAWTGTIEGREIIITIVKNITEHKLLNQILSNKLEQAYTIINKSSMVAFSFNNKDSLEVKFVTENIKKLTGYASDEFLTGGITYADCIHPEDIQKVKISLKKLEQYGQNELILKPYRLISKDGEEKLVKNRVMAIKNEMGKITLYECIVENITKENEIETELKKTNEILVRLNAAMNGREFRILELKEEVNTLLKELNQPVKYHCVD